jgi:FkbM family methyltransferase
MTTYPNLQSRPTGFPRTRPRLIRRRLWYELLRRIASRRLARDRLVRFDEGLVMTLRLTDPIERAIYLYGAYEYRLASVFRELLRAGMHVIDVGAHDGQYTLLAAKGVGASGKVLAVEPDPSRRARLAGNVERNDLSNVIISSAAVSDTPGDGLLFVPTLDALSGQASLRRNWCDEGTFKPIRVRTERLDDLIEGVGWRQLDIIKLDVEGVEAQVIAGGRTAIEKHLPVVVFEVNDLVLRDGFAAAPAMERLREFGYTITAISAIGGRRWRLQPLEPGKDPRPFREPWFPLNLVALPPGYGALGAIPSPTSRSSQA